MRHPLILAHDQTYDRKFPLILIVGREPNNKSVSNGNLGLMNFVRYSRCAFWNVAFGVFGKINNSSCREMKQQFIRRKASPILFVDAFPKGIQNSITGKHSIRLEQIELASEQIDAIFSHTEVLQRVKLVVLSGLDNTIFENFKSLLKQRLSGSEVVIRETPFLYPTNTSKILERFTEHDQELLKNIYKSFTLETDDLPELPEHLLNRYEMDAPDTLEGIISPVN